MEDQITILIVDDEQAGREALEGVLFAQGYQLLFAENGPVAIAKALEFTPDLVLLDVMMPEMDGFEVCRRMRAHPLLEEIPILIVTALDDRDARLRGIEAGADDFITKPFDRIELRARVRTVTRLNRYRRSLVEKARFAWVVEQAGEGYLVLDENGNIQYANRAARGLLGLPPGEDVPLGESFLEAARRTFRCEPAAAWEAWNADDQYLADPVYLVQPETALSQPLWYEVQALSLPGGERRSRLLRISEINEQVASLLGRWNLHTFLSHKLRTPLSNLVFGAEILAQHAGKLPPEEIAQVAQDVFAGSKRIEGDINEILRFVHAPAIAAGQKPVAAADLPGIVQAVAEEIGLPRVSLAIEGEVAAGKAVRLSQFAARTIFSELFENARKFHPRLDPTVEVWIAARPDGGLTLSVADDGVHLSAYQLRHALAPYFQAEKYFTGQIEGMGLGLATVASLVWGAGGECRLANRAGQPGVVVEITLEGMAEDETAARLEAVTALVD